MTVHAVMEKVATLSQNVDSENVDFRCAADVDHGNVIQLLTRSATAGEKGVFVATAPATGSLENLFMVAEFGTVTVYGEDGNEYVGLTDNPQYSYVKAGKVWTAFKLHKGDRVRLTAEALAGTKSTNTFINASDGVYTLTWGATATASALALELLDTETITIGGSTVGVIGGTGRVVAYVFRVVQN
jgi:hypothetical protein